MWNKTNRIGEAKFYSNPEPKNLVGKKLFGLSG